MPGVELEQPHEMSQPEYEVSFVWMHLPCST
jgi:hypothetical protein